jgi:hypothetical protein
MARLIFMARLINMLIILFFFKGFGQGKDPYVEIILRWQFMA